MLTPALLSAATMTLPQALGPEPMLAGAWAESWVRNWAAPAFGLAAMAMLVGLPLLAAAKALAPQQVPAESWAEDLDRKVSAICAAAFALMGGLCGGLALAALLAQGQLAVLGLGAPAAAFLSAALFTAGQTRRR